MCRSDYAIASDYFLPRVLNEEMDDIRIETTPTLRAKSDLSIEIDITL